MKQTNYRFTFKRKLSFRLEIFARRVENWLDENYKKAFFGFMMACLFVLQLLLFLWLH